MQNTTSKIVRVVRFVRLLGHIISGFIQSLVYPYFSQAVQKRLMQNWATRFINILGIQLTYRGELPGIDNKQVLFVANHVSWLDICVLMAICPTRFVAKSEIRGWPVIGRLSLNTGTLFIHRAKRRDTLRINKDIAAALKTGDRVVIFPEGTTSDGVQIKHFHASLFESAVAPDVALYPIAISYRNMAGNISEEAPFIGDSLLTSLRKILSQRKINVNVSVMVPVKDSGMNRRALARFAEQSIANALSISVEHNQPEKSSGLPDE